MFYFFGNNVFLSLKQAVNSYWSGLGWRDNVNIIFGLIFDSFNFLLLIILNLN